LHRPDHVLTSTPEEVVSFKDDQTGVSGAIVIHSTALGPAAGGCRLWRYHLNDSAVRDALRLAGAMTLKNALAELPLGGGKIVLSEPVGSYDRQALFRAVGRAVNALQGRYVTAEDVGTSVDDMAIVAEETRYVAGLSAIDGHPGGDPSPWTALGVFEAMSVAVRHHLDVDIGDVTVAVQGLGHVGFALCELLHAAGAKLLVAEPRHHIAQAAVLRFGAHVLGSVALANADVFAPCAMGGAVDHALARNLRARVVCGAANNQLAGDEQARQLAARGILYAPDFLVNAGGIVNVCGEYLKWTEADVRARVHQIGPRLAAVLRKAETDGILPHQAAKSLANQRILESHSFSRPPLAVAG
jgi:leucine dehydrogenase